MKNRNSSPSDRKAKGKSLSEDTVAQDPFTQFANWFSEAAAVVKPDVNAMCLATSGPGGRPSARIVLLREVDWRGFVFFTGYKSRKGQDLAQNPYVAATFHWKEQDRQVRITGKAKKISRKESEAYFLSRPLESRISAAVSPQSEVIPGRAYLEKLREVFTKSLVDPENLSCPEDWGGYRIVPGEIEFWQGREHRFHDRIVYIKKGKGWIIRRLAP